MKTNLKPRLITALVGIPLLVVVIQKANSLQFAVVIFVITGASLYEYFQMAFPRQRRDRILGIGFGMIVCSWIIFRGFSDGVFWLGGFLVILFSTYLLSEGGLEERFTRLAWTLIGVLYLGYLLPHWVLLFRSPDGRQWVFLVLLVVMTGDTVAYFTGSLVGRIKIAPHISPGKTVEGAVGFVIGGLFAGLVGTRYLLPELKWPEVVSLAVLLTVLGQLGDLFESWVKRVFYVKDSGALLPGHGGLLDRLDSLIFPVVCMTYYVGLFHS